MNMNLIISDLIENNIERILKYLGGRVKAEFKKSQVRFRIAFQNYLSTSYNKYSKVKTILYNDEPIYLYEFFVCNELENDRFTIDTNEHIKDLLNISHYIIITGSGGIGKSMMMRHFLIKAIQDKTYIPILLELRDYSDFPGDFQEFIYHSLTALEFDLEMNYFQHGLSTGCFVFLLDGLDEVKSNRYLKLCKEIEYLCSRYKKNYYIITSRPGKGYESYFQQFTVLKCMEFTKEQSIMMINRLSYDYEIKQKFINYLRDKLYESHKTFASNPLLLTILLLTYHEYAEIPDKLHLFYSYAFDTLYIKHDARKGFKRDFRSDLSVDDFRLVLATFCMRTYIQEIYEFTSDDIRKLIKEILDKKVKTKASTEDYIDDLCTAVCILIREGVRYRFSHRSFQEYFTALCIRDLSDSLLSRICNYMIYESQTQILQDDMILMLYDMIPERFETCIMIPILEKLENDMSGDRQLEYTKLLFPRLRMKYSSDQFTNFEISYNNSPVIKLLLTAIKRNHTISDAAAVSDKTFWYEMRKRHIKLTEPMVNIINEHGNEFMDIFLQTRMGLMIKNTLHLKNRLQEKYNEEIYLLDELLK